MGHSSFLGEKREGRVTFLVKILTHVSVLKFWILSRTVKPGIEGTQRKVHTCLKTSNISKKLGRVEYTTRVGRLVSSHSSYVYYVRPCVLCSESLLFLKPLGVQKKFSPRHQFGSSRPFWVVSKVTDFGRYLAGETGLSKEISPRSNGKCLL